MRKRPVDPLARPVPREESQLSPSDASLRPTVGAAPAWDPVSPQPLPVSSWKGPPGRPATSCFTMSSPCARVRLCPGPQCLAVGPGTALKATLGLATPQASAGHVSPPSPHCPPHSTELLLPTQPPCPCDQCSIGLPRPPTPGLFHPFLLLLQLPPRHCFWAQGACLERCNACFSLPPCFAQPLPSAWPSPCSRSSLNFHPSPRSETGTPPLPWKRLLPAVSPVSALLRKLSPNSHEVPRCHFSESSPSHRNLRLLYDEPKSESEYSPLIRQSRKPIDR